MARKGEYVEIKLVLLKPEERAEHLPEDTKNLPFEAKVRGYLLHDANIGDSVEIETPIGRKVKGILISVSPPYRHNFGKPIRELIDIGKKIRERYLEERNGES